MERFETDLVADDGGNVHLYVGPAGSHVHVVVEPALAPLGDWIARLADNNADRPAIPLESLDRARLYDRESSLP